ncbi:MAG: hypothetical protein WC564_00375 [Patescibacteria group bacterium]|jgi:hypothetical protein
MNRRQYIIIASAVLIVIVLAVWLGLIFFSPKKNGPTSNNNQAISIPKTSYTDRLAMLQDLLSKKLGKNKENVLVNIARENNTHIKGIVSVKDDYEGIFLATRVSGEWEIVWDGKSNYSCQDIKEYNFPGEMVSDCTK